MEIDPLLRAEVQMEINAAQMDTQDLRNPLIFDHSFREQL